MHPGTARDEDEGVRTVLRKQPPLAPHRFLNTNELGLQRAMSTITIHAGILRIPSTMYPAAGKAFIQVRFRTFLTPNDSVRVSVSLEYSDSCVDQHRDSLSFSQYVLTTSLTESQQDTKMRPR
jgi:hypothetical protein